MRMVADTPYGTHRAQLVEQFVRKPVCPDNLKRLQLVARADQVRIAGFVHVFPTPAGNPAHIQQRLDAVQICLHPSFGAIGIIIVHFAQQTMRQCQPIGLAPRLFVYLDGKQADAIRQEKQVQAAQGQWPAVSAKPVVLQAARKVQPHHQVGSAAIHPLRLVLSGFDQRIHKTFVIVVACLAVLLLIQHLALPPCIAAQYLLRIFLRIQMAAQIRVCMPYLQFFRFHFLRLFLPYKVHAFREVFQIRTPRTAQKFYSKTAPFSIAPLSSSASSRQFLLPGKDIARLSYPPKCGLLQQDINLG